ncbi:MAG: glycine cleavage T C-terminal barrel domain-containing protein, partial [Alphaproteobacteria bacterium]
QKAGLIGVYEPHPTEAWPNSNNSPAWESESELFTNELDRVLPYIERVFKRMPVYANAGIKRIVNGAIPHSPDGNPLLGPAAGLRNAWMCCGSSIGIAQGGGCGKYLAQWMVHGDAEINMAGMDPRRFGPYADRGYTAAKSNQDYAHMYALHLPGEERDAGRPARKSTLYERLKAKGAVHTEAFGWERPKWFALDRRTEKAGFRRNNTHDVVAAECRAVREAVGILDLSSFAKFEVTGGDAESFLNRVYANRVPRRAGGIALAHRLGANGRIQGESTITRLGEGRFYVLSGASWQIRDRDALDQARRPGEDVTVADVSDDIGILVLAGPKARDVLGAVTEADLTNAAFPWLTGRTIRAAGIDVIALRVNYVGSLGWELHAPMTRLAGLYDALWSAGREHGIADFGVYALNSLRMEKAYKGLAVEMTNEITPVEADILRFVRRDKDFEGRPAVEAVRQAGHAIQLVYAEVAATDADARGGEPVFDGAACVGVTTSGGYGHHTGKSLVFAYVPLRLARPGATFDIAILGERRRCTVLAEAAYDPANAALEG